MSLSNPFRGINATTDAPLASLRSRQWVKLICGASYQDLPKIRNLALVYALAGVDCIDMAADPAVITAVREGVAVARLLYQKAFAPNASTDTEINAELDLDLDLEPLDISDLNINNQINNQAAPNPWLMVSLNAGEDPHFRKAEFNYLECLTHCDRPCVDVCPTQAIQFNQVEVHNDRAGLSERNNQIREQGKSGNSGNSGNSEDLSFTSSASHLSNLATKPQGEVLDNLCYGCGRCLAVCPLSIINTREHTYTPEILLNEPIDAIEIHIQPWRVEEFKRLWQRLLPVIPKLKLLAISFPDCDNLKDYLLALLEWMKPLPQQLVWQADGRPMSGDIGNGTTQAAIKLGQKVLGFELPIGFVQIAGGTNASTARKIDEAQVKVAGVAYGSYARKLIMDLLEQGGDRLEANPQLLKQAILKAKNLVGQTKHKAS
ncbi:4Fe-4S ferredoxin iron-sulfur binding domain-containing protein [Thalassoporum mexicanum PCC 7367]|uniref:Light dependent period protein LdpA domain-containing protein n=1 Tax=Thalassoporum mexicanum TaxID=3457544 RepID=UPI00029F8A7D|nr:4Fe-4S ferredoxin iron-sulfur binding domain-containing protein [Pseudanabaena sp. PCC 7367]